jgi:hypothetical protein
MPYWPIRLCRSRLAPPTTSLCDTVNAYLEISQAASDKPPPPLAIEVVSTA